MAGSAILTIKILTDATKAQAGLKDVEKSAGGFGDKLKKGSLLAAGALAAVGAVALDAARSAAEDEQAQAVLANTLQKSAGATKEQVAATEDWISKTAAATGVADDQLRPALANLVRATGDVTKSQDAMGVALDVAAATGQDVESVSKAMAKGYAGNTAALGKLVPGLDKAVLKSGDMSQVMKELQRTTGGAAAAAADTAAGKWQRFQLAISETKESAGAALLPILSKLGDVLTVVGNLAQNHAGAFTAIAAVIAVVAVAVMALSVAETIYTAVTTLAGSATIAAWVAALWPILLVIAAVAAVVAVVILLWNKCSAFRNAILAIWAGIQVATAAVASFFTAVWNAAFALVSAYVRAYMAVVMAVFNAIRAAATAIAGGLKTAWGAVWTAISTGANIAKTAATTAFNGVKTVVSTVSSFVSTTWGAMVTGVTRAMSGLASVLSAPFNAVHTAVMAVVSAVESLIGWLGRIKIPKISLPKIPGFNASAAAVPTGVGGGFSATALGARAAAPRAVSPTPTIIIQGAIDPESTARQIRRILDAHDRRQGLTGVLRPSGLAV
jgi:phage-related protein